ncbi:hypothetical protein COU20_00115 [Candidatus Kaiserbacteria bacterium CG10_big_fil_rev_8_21_14_0_10_59_10]|uniref:Uncharacterized protein n=1 Tax=Candidatus Kaiserbacteria bacterium CG10_big_fil_rev_8_21_14_0_10_59_10 TaxID=1974612 RepID=A0A2H0U8V8_9BACT|nr:MAG: hypothetical protein COU20_00115 [Candidatus Kaiserbacteria bacterium CG10_big_fil_rev_8_21_14_0_10_59_10]
MAQIPVIKIRCFITRDRAEALITRLHTEGIAELIEEISDETLHTDAQETFEHRHRSAHLDTAVDFLSSYHHDPDPFRGVFEGSRVETNTRAIKALLENYDTESVLGEVHRIQTRLIEIDAKLKAGGDEERIVRAWARLNFPLAAVTDSATTVVFPLHGTARELDLIEEALFEEKLAHLERVGESTLLVIAHRDVKGSVENALREAEVEVLRLPRKNETAAAVLREIDATRSTLEDEKAFLESEALSVARRELASLKQLADNARWAMRERDTAAGLSRSASVAVFDAWVPEAAWKLFLPRLSRDFPTAAFEAREIPKEEIPPTLIENRGLVRPFEFITRLYGVPSHKDLDPTPFLSAFFFVFFGLSLSDFGYGITLMALTGATLIRYKVQSGMRSLLTTLFFGGFGAAVVGILYGGYFGISAVSIHPALGRLQAFDPIANPMPVFYLALGMGVVQVMFGIVLDIVRAAKNKDLMNGMLDNVPWLLMFLILIAFIIAKVGIVPEALALPILGAWGTFAIAAALLISLTKARLGKGIADMLLKGVLALYGGVNYFSDILSYSRLLALGLATSALGFSINLIAGIVGGEGVGFGTIFAVLVLIAGHTLNITISTLGAFIHSSRLQYVEFFGKFLQGTGRPFTPFVRETKHTILLPDTPG